MGKGVVRQELDQRLVARLRNQALCAGHILILASMPAVAIAAVSFTMLIAYSLVTAPPKQGVRISGLVRLRLSRGCIAILGPLYAGASRKIGSHATYAERSSDTSAWPKRSAVRWIRQEQVSCPRGSPRCHPIIIRLPMG